MDALRQANDFGRQRTRIGGGVQLQVVGVAPAIAWIVGAALPIAKKDEVKTGKATILATVSGNETREYDIEIEKIYSPSGSTRNLLLRVTDEELLAQTGGGGPGRPAAAARASIRCNAGLFMLSGVWCCG